MAKFGLSDVIYNGRNLSEILGIKVLNYSLLNAPKNATTSNRVAMAHRSATSRHFISKQITIQVVIEPAQVDLPDINWLEAVMGRLREISQVRWYDLSLVAGILENNGGEWEYGNETLTWKETRIESFNIDQIGKQAVVDMTFISDEPIGLGATTQELFKGTAITDTEKVFDLAGVDLQGTFYLQYPCYEILVNSVDKGDNPSLTISNGFTKLIYTGEITNGDILTIDCRDVQVLKNGNLVDFDGALPVIDKDTTRSITITHTYDALDYDIITNNQPGYI